MKKIKKEIQDRLDQIPIGAHIVIFAKNPATKLWGWIETHYKEIPTHSAIYIGEWDGRKNVILESVQYTEFNEIYKYLKKDNVKIVAQWYTDLTVNEKIEIHHRIIWFAGRKFFYDIAGYAGFFTRLIPFLRKIFPPSNKRPFCSELVATIWEGDKKSAYETIKKLWFFVRAFSSKPNPTATAPIDGYSYMLKNNHCRTLIIKDKKEKVFE